MTNYYRYHSGQHSYNIFAVTDVKVRVEFVLAPAHCRFFFAFRFCFVFYIPVGTAATAVAFIVQYPFDATLSLTLNTPVDDSHGVPLTSNSWCPNSIFFVLFIIFTIIVITNIVVVPTVVKNTKNNYFKIFKFRKCVFHEPWRTGSAVVAEVIEDIIAIADKW